MTPPRPSRYASALLLALSLFACSGRSDDASGAGGQLLPLKANATVITDSLGREVLLRGINHIGLRSNGSRPLYRVDGVVTPDAQLFDLQDLEDEDFARIASFGFNFVRPVFSWEFAQPDPPPAPFNEAYFKRIGDFLDKAAAHGLYVLFDFGQFGWSRAAGGNAGAPDWALSETCKSLPGPVGNLPPQASVRVGCAFLEFWQNEPLNDSGPGMQDLYIDLWREVMRRYHDHPAVVMVDLFNEPLSIPLPPLVFERQFLHPFYRRLAAAIREIDADIIIGYQPELFHSLGIPVPETDAIGIDNAVFLPHNYTVAYFTQRVDPSYLPAQEAITRADLALTAVSAATLGSPFVLGETGWTRSTAADGVGGPAPSTDPTAPPKFGESLVRIANEMKIGWAWFAYSSVDEAYGILDGEELDEPLMRTLATPFPRAIGGGLDAISFDPGSKVFEVRVREAVNLPAELALPLHWQYPEGACLRADGQAIARIAANGTVQKLGEPAASYNLARAVLTVAATPRSLSLARLDAACAAP